MPWQPRCWHDRILREEVVRGLISGIVSAALMKSAAIWLKVSVNVDRGTSRGESVFGMIGIPPKNLAALYMKNPLMK
jgi:hypothetical protein